MEIATLKTLSLVAGIGGIAFAVLFLLFRKLIGAIIRKDFFPKLTRSQAYNFVRLIIIVTFLVTLFGIGGWIYLNSLSRNESASPQNNGVGNVENLTQQIIDARTTINNKNSLEKNKNNIKTSSDNLSIPQKEKEKTNSNITNTNEQGLYTGGTSCPNPLSSACLDCMKLSFIDPGPACTDFPLLDASLNTDGYSKNAEDWEKGRIAHSGDIIYAVVYVNNGAADNATVNPIAKNVSITTEIDSEPKFLHYISVKITSDTTDSIESKFKILTNENEKLEVVANSGEFFDTFGHKLLSGANVGNNTLKIGDLPPHYEDALFIRFKLKVNLI